MSKKKVKKEVSDLFVNLFVRVGERYSDSEYTYEMLKVGVTKRQLPRAALEFAMDNMPLEFDRLNESEQNEVEKRLKTYFKRSLS